MSRYASGVRVMRLAEGSKVATFVRAEHDEEEATEQVEAAAETEEDAEQLAKEEQELEEADSALAEELSELEETEE